LYGTVIRINPTGNNSHNGRYGIPRQNPFVKDSNALGEIYANGFRNPHRITWNRNGDMLVSNIGHGNIESINLVQKGNDFGWPIREGSFLLNPYADMNKVYALPADDSLFNITYPIAEYDHGEGKAISGGYEYTGNAIPALKGKFLFGDIPTGRLFYVNVKDLQKGKLATIKEWHVSINGTIQNLKKLCGSDRVDLHFGRDANGEMYIMTKADGRLYLLTGATE
jgi:glucose/arabinose dehydrogenase